MGYKIQQNQIEDLVFDLTAIRDSITGLETSLLDVIEDTESSILTDLEATGQYLDQQFNNYTGTVVGNMSKAIYDTGDVGVVDDSSKLGDELPEFYLNSANHTGTLPSGNLPNVTGTPGTYTLATVTIDSKGRVTAASNGVGGVGDMLKSVYDTDNDGVIDNSEALNGQPASYYTNAANLTGTIGTGQLGAADGRYLKLNGGGTVTGNIYSIGSINATSSLSAEQTVVSFTGRVYSISEDVDTAAVFSLFNYGTPTGYPYELGAVTVSNSSSPIAKISFNKEGNFSTNITLETQDAGGVLHDVLVLNPSGDGIFRSGVYAENFYGNGSSITGLNGANITGDVPSGSIPDTSVTPGTYTLSTISIDSAGRITYAANGSGGAGDMEKSVYDTDDNGIVDNSERLGGELPSYYRDVNNLTGDSYLSLSGGTVTGDVIIDANLFTENNMFVGGELEISGSAIIYGNISSESGVISCNSYDSGITPSLNFITANPSITFPHDVSEITSFDGGADVVSNIKTVLDGDVTGKVLIQVADTGLILRDVASFGHDQSTTFYGDVIGSFYGDGSNLTGLPSPSFESGVSGLDFNIISDGNNHTFNIPDASTSGRGLITTGAQEIGGVKTFTSDIYVENYQPRIEFSCTGALDGFIEKRAPSNLFRIVSENYPYILDEALALNGSGYASRSNVTLGTVYTIAFWYKTSSTASQMVVGGPTSGHHILFWFGTSTQVLCRTNTGVQLDWTVSYADSNWHHWAIVVNGTSVSLYKDATLVSTQTAGSISSRTFSHVGSYGDANHKCVGSIDQMVLYSTNLSVGDIIAMYNSGAGTEVTDYTNVIAEYRFNAGYSDSSPNSYTLTAGGSGNSFVVGAVGGTIGAEEVAILSCSDSAVSSSLADLMLGTYSSTYGTTVILEGLNHKMRILGTEYFNVDSAGASFSAGTAAAPSLSLISERTSGFYKIGSSNIGLSLGGVLKYDFSTAALRGVDGTVSLPGWSFTGDTNSGLYRIGADSIGLATNGTARMTIDTTTNTISTLLIQSYAAGNNYNENMRLPAASDGYVCIAMGSSGATGTAVGQWNILRFPSASSYKFTIRYNSTDAVIINTSGQFGVGTDPSARIHAISTTEQLRLGYDASNYFSTTVSSAGAVTFNAVGASAGFTFSDNVTLDDAKNLIFNTTTGTKIGTSTSQKLSLWNATPIVQPTTAIAAATFVANTSLIFDDSATWGGYTIGQIVQALRNMGALA